jgi:predicted DCC family thiol-disulfide oxidoreductase YuxK
VRRGAAGTTGSVPAATVLYDADCGFCRAGVAALLRFDRHGRLLPETIQSPEGQRLLAAVAPEQRLERAHVVLPDGRIHSGGDAVAPIARLLPGFTPVAVIAGALGGPLRSGYDWVAGHRTGLSRFVPRTLKDRAAERIAAHRDRVVG